MDEAMAAAEEAMAEASEAGTGLPWVVPQAITWTMVIVRTCVSVTVSFCIFVSVTVSFFVSVTVTAAPPPAGGAVALAPALIVEVMVLMPAAAVPFAGAEACAPTVTVCRIVEVNVFTPAWPCSAPAPRPRLSRIWSTNPLLTGLFP